MEILTRQFGLLIAYLLPGFVALAGVAALVPAVAAWLRADQTTSLGAPLYALLAATAAGMVVSCFRWLLVDRAILFFGVAAPSFNAKALEEKPTAFNYLVENHYRFYQFYANTLVAVIWTYWIVRSFKLASMPRPGTDLGVAILCAVLFAGARDALSKYRARSVQLVGQTGFTLKGEAMTNGIDHHQGQGQGSKQPPAREKSDKPAAAPKPPTAHEQGKASKA